MVNMVNMVFHLISAVLMYNFDFRVNFDNVVTEMGQQF